MRVVRDRLRVAEPFARFRSFRERIVKVMESRRDGAADDRMDRDSNVGG